MVIARKENSMSGEERRKKVLNLIKESSEPVPGSVLSASLDVSRQVIVQDIALLRASNYDIISTTKGYILNRSKETDICKAEFEINHSDEEIEKELQLIVDLGGIIKDVFIKHKVYGELHAELNIRSRRDIKNYLANMENGKAVPLKNVTSGYHFHTILAENEETLKLIKEALDENGLLVKTNNK